MTSYIFGGQTGLTYEQVQKQREIANELLRANMQTPQNVGEGLSAIGRALAAKAIDKRTARADEANRAAYEAKRGEIFGALGGFGGGAPAYGAASAPPVAGPTPITFTPETPNPGGLDPSIISAVDRVAPNKPEVMDANAVGSRLVSDLMRDLNLTQEQAAGVVGNLAHETGGFKHMQEISPVVPGSRGGYGFAQWTGPRRVAFEQWAAQNNLDPNSYEANYGFLQHELKNTPEGAVLGPLSQAQTAEQAAQVFSDQFLRPGVPAMGSRVALANQFVGGQPSPQPAGQPQPAGGPSGGMANPAILMALADIQGNPYASESDKAIASLLMNQTAQAMDPMRQMEMERTRLEIDRMKNPQPGFTMLNDEQEAQMGLDTSGVYQQGADGSIVTVREPAKPVEATTLERQYERAKAEGYQGDFVQYQMDLKKAGASNTTVNNTLNPDAPGPGADEDALRGALGKKEGEAWSTYLDSAVTSSGTMQDMQLLDELINVAPQGPLQGRLAQAFPGVSAAADAFQSVVKRVAPTLRAPGSGATSDIEYEGMLKSLPQLSSTPEANRAIAGMMKAKAEINMQRGEIVRQYQNGELSLTDARKRITEIDQKSIMSPELKALLDALGPAPEADNPYSSMSDEELMKAIGQ